ncbi:hypothetical protein EV363DRAFT_1296016 [Boletus edulis]|nr:hypothetical protein EV363DRAFT_1296016 [Boletus edulis]
MQGRWSTPLNIHFGNLLHTKGVVPLNIIFVFPPPALTPSANPGAAVPDPNSIHFGPTAKGKKGKPSTLADPHEQLNEPGTRGRMNTIWLGPLNEEYVNPLVLEAKSNLNYSQADNLEAADGPIIWTSVTSDYHLNLLKMTSLLAALDSRRKKTVLMDGPSVTLQEDADVIMFAGWLQTRWPPRLGWRRCWIETQGVQGWLNWTPGYGAEVSFSLFGCSPSDILQGTLTAVQAEKFTEEVGRSGFLWRTSTQKLLKKLYYGLMEKRKLTLSLGRQVFFGDASSSNAAIGPCLNTCFDIFLKMAARRVELIRGQKAMLQALDRIVVVP